jgi:RNA polymerase sigma-70 factor (ECF subfamily)
MEQDPTATSADLAHLAPEVWQGLGDSLVRSFRRRGASQAEAEDLRQESLARLHESLVRRTRGSPPTSVSSIDRFLQRIARNLLVDRARARERQTPAELVADPPSRPPVDRLDSLVASWLPEMIDTLAKESRSVLRLSELEGLPHREIARRLGLSLSGVKSRVQRGRAKLREALLACCAIELDRRGGIAAVEKRRTECACDGEA